MLMSCRPEKICLFGSLSISIAGLLALIDKVVLNILLGLSMFLFQVPEEFSIYQFSKFKIQKFEENKPFKL